MTKVKCGIIGLGIMGKHGGEVLQLVDEAEIVALAEPLRKNMEEAAEIFKGAAQYKDYNEMLEKENLDVVYVATPDIYHRDPVIASLKAGVNVLVEKPMTTDQKEAEEIVKVVKETGKKLQVSFNHRWLSAYYHIKEMIENGELGEPIIGFARKNNPISVPTTMLAAWGKDSSPAWFLSSHDIDLMTWWFDASPVEVYARGIKRKLKELKGWDTWNGIQSLVTYDNGQFATFEAAWIYPNTSPYLPDSYMEVIGTEGTAQIDRQREAIDVIGKEKFHCPRTFLGSKVFGEWQGAYPASVRSFIHAVINDTKPHVDEIAGLKSTAVLDAIHKSLATGKPIKIEYGIDF